MKTLFLACAAAFALSACSTRQGTTLVYGSEGLWRNRTGEPVVTPLHPKTSDIEEIQRQMESAPPAYQPTRPAEPDLPVRNPLPPKYFL